MASAEVAAAAAAVAQRQQVVEEASSSVVMGHWLARAWTWWLVLAAAAARGEDGRSVGPQVQTGAQHGVVISHELGQQIFLIDVRPAVHIHLSAQLQQLINLHFGAERTRCRLFGRVAPHRSRWVARLFAPSSGPLFLRRVPYILCWNCLPPSSHTAKMARMLSCLSHHPPPV